MLIHVGYTIDRNPGGPRQVMRFLEKAMALAEFSDCPKRHGCVIVKHGTVVGTGFNRHRNSPEVLAESHVLTGSSVHAEVSALRMAGTNANGADMYVARIGAKGAPLLSRPCDRCYSEIIKAGISEIYHT